MKFILLLLLNLLQMNLYSNVINFESQLTKTKFYPQECPQGIWYSNTSNEMFIIECVNDSIRHLTYAKNNGKFDKLKIKNLRHEVSITSGWFVLFNADIEGNLLQFTISIRGDYQDFKVVNNRLKTSVRDFYRLSINTIEPDTNIRIIDLFLDFAQTDSFLLYDQVGVKKNTKIKFFKSDEILNAEITYNSHNDSIAQKETVKVQVDTIKHTFSFELKNIGLVKCKIIYKIPNLVFESYNSLNKRIGFLYKL